MAAFVSFDFKCALAAQSRQGLISFYKSYKLKLLMRDLSTSPSPGIVNTVAVVHSAHGSPKHTALYAPAVANGGAGWLHMRCCAPHNTTTGSNPNDGGGNRQAYCYLSIFDTHKHAGSALS